MYANAFRVLKCCVVVGALSALWLNSVHSNQEPAKIDFRRDVQPILKQFCIDCNGASLQMNAFRLDRRRDAMRGGAKPGYRAGQQSGKQAVSQADRKPVRSADAADRSPAARTDRHPESLDRSRR